MRYFNNYSEDDVVSKILYAFLSFTHGSLGIFLILDDFDRFSLIMLNTMNNLISMNSWGVIFIIVALGFIGVAIQEGRTKSIFMLISGFLGAMVFGVMAMTSIEVSLRDTNTMNYVLVSSVDLLIAILGGITLWKRRM